MTRVNAGRKGSLAGQWLGHGTCAWREYRVSCVCEKRRVKVVTVDRCILLLFTELANHSAIVSCSISVPHRQLQFPLKGLPANL